ncbi:MAG TPA: LamG domain-containing protein [Gemmataceae bacterium]|nr:LamG domain-containing protein [Gemmataceae bacterium]
MKRFERMGLGVGLAVLALGALAPCAWADISYSSVIIGDGPVGYYRLGEAQADSVAFDSSGYQFTRNGVYSRGVVNGVAGAIKGDTDTAANFDGMTSFVAVDSGQSSPFNNTNSFSLEAWVINAGSLENYSRIISTRVLPPATSGGFGLGIVGASNNARFTTFGVKDYDSSATNIPVDGMWHHLVVVMDSTNTANFFLDGQQTDAIPFASPCRTSPSDLFIGRNPVSDGNPGLYEYWNGSIDEVAIYNYELTPGQIAAHYAAAQ